MDEGLVQPPCLWRMQLLLPMLDLPKTSNIKDHQGHSYKPANKLDTRSQEGLKEAPRCGQVGVANPSFLRFMIHKHDGQSMRVGS